MKQEYLHFHWIEYFSYQWTPYLRKIKVLEIKHGEPCQFFQYMRYEIFTPGNMIIDEIMKNVTCVDELITRKPLTDVAYTKPAMWSIRTFQALKYNKMSAIIEGALSEIFTNCCR